jgi:ribosome-binding protein aMBF1 (putative translation factor)
MRPTIKCKTCKLNQFATKNGRCRKCRASFTICEVKLEPPTPKPQESAEETVFALENHVSSTFPIAVRYLRARSGHSQRQFAKILGYPRTFVSKIERGLCDPKAQTIYRFSLALGCSPAHMLLFSEGIYDAIHSKGIK